MKQIISYILIFFIASLTYGQDKKVVKFVDEYTNIAFWEIQGRYQPLIKWPSDGESLKYKIVGEFQYMNEKAWSKFIAEIHTLTGLSLTETNQNDFDILIYFGELKNYADLTGTQIPPNVITEFNNWSSRNWDKSYALTKSSFCLVPSLIRDTNEGIYRLKKGVIKSLGLLGEIEDEYSIFHKYPAPTNTRISRKDKRFIKLHYSNSIKSGLNKEVIKEIVLKIPNIEELSKEKL